MTLKFKMKSKIGALENKEQIRGLAEAFGYVTFGDVKGLCGDPVDKTYPDVFDYTFGWKRSDLNGMNAVVRKVRDSWYLYLCDPREGLEYDGHDKNASFIRLIDGGMEVHSPATSKIQVHVVNVKEKVIVHHKLSKKTTVERKAYFHKWTTNRVQKEDGTIIDQDLAICEFLDDGHIERIAWDHVRFVEEWEDE